MDVEVFALRELVTDLYFRTLLLQESEAILISSQEDLQSRFKQAEALVKEGVALRTNADQVKIQILKIDQQLVSLRADKQALLKMLAKWVGRAVVPVAIAADSGYVDNRPSSARPLFSSSQRPEHQLFMLQQRSFELAKQTLALRSQPRIEAFAQGGIGRPNPFNFFETGFQPFVLLGLRAAWTPFDWGNRGRDAQVLDLQIKNVAAQQQTFEQRLEATTWKDQADIDKQQAQVKQDDDIIALQQDIVRRAEAQVKNGVMTMTDYLSQVNLLTQARLLRTTHVVQAAQAREILLAKTGE